MGAQIQHKKLLVCLTERDVPSKKLTRLVVGDLSRFGSTRSRVSDARLPVGDLSRFVDQHVAPTAACLQQNIPLRCSTSQRGFSRSGTHLTTPRRSVTRHPHGKQESCTNQSTRTVASRLFSTTRYRKETRALQRIAMLDPATVAHGQTIPKSLPALFARPTLTPAPPIAGLGRPRANNVVKTPGNFARSSICQSPVAVEPGGHADGR